MDMLIRIALADDQRLLREGLRIILDATPDITVVGIAEDGLAAIELARAERPDVMLLDIRMPRCDGIEATRRIREVAPETRIILLTTYDLPELMRDGVQAGAAGFVLKDCGPEELRAAVRTVARGQMLLQGQSISQLLAGAILPNAITPIEDKTALTERERDVLRCIARGLSNGEIAAELVVSEATVKTHINHLFAKLGARDRTHAVLLGQQQGVM